MSRRSSKGVASLLALATLPCVEVRLQLPDKALIIQRTAYGLAAAEREVHSGANNQRDERDSNACDLIQVNPCEKDLYQCANVQGFVRYEVTLIL